jgi:hypothetical protein
LCFNDTATAEMYSKIHTLSLGGALLVLLYRH